MENILDAILSDFREVKHKLYRGVIICRSQERCEYKMELIDTAQLIRYGIQVLTATIGTVGFAILFQIRGYRLIAIAFGGAMSWVVYLLSFIQHYDAVASSLIATIVVAAFAEVGARILKTPVIILLAPMLIPLIPGRDLYYTMQHLVFGRMGQSAYYFQLVLKEAGAIAFGIILLAFLSQFIQKLRNYLIQMNHKKIKKIL